jgi:hypothetical protein
MGRSTVSDAPESFSLERTLKLADEVRLALGEEGVDCLLIGALALAVHGYPRDTQDLDLAVAVLPRTLQSVADKLEERGHLVQFRLPDPQDPLGGVLDVRATEGGELVQVVNFSNPPAGGFPKLVEDSLKDAVSLPTGTALKVVDPYHLVVFKLYAGGRKSEHDILELLERHPELDMERLRALCAGYRMERELEQVLSAFND